MQQLALAWLFAQDNVSAIAAMKSPAHLADNISAAELKLAPDDILRLKKDYPEQREISRVPLR